MNDDQRGASSGSEGEAMPHRSEPPQRGQPSPRRRVGLSARIGRALLVAGALLGLALALVALLVRDRLPPLTAAELDQAERRWQAASIGDYEMDVTVSGRQPSNFHVEVRGGRPVALTRDGVVPRRGMWDVWTAPGMFDTLHQELDLAADPAGPFGSPPGTQVVQRVEFDADYGFPKKYHRIVMGTPLEIAWEVVNFRPVDAQGKSE